MWNHQLDEVLGDDSGVTGMRIKNLKDDTTKDIDLQGVFIAIGHKPNTKMFADQLDIHNGYLAVKGGAGGNGTTITTGFVGISTYLGSNTFGGGGGGGVDP